MKLHEISPAAGSTTAPKRLGRGVGSGLGKTSGKGHKGGKARSGGGKGPGFEGGQMKLIMRIPKRGFTNKFAKEYVAINVSALEAFEDGAVVDALALKNAGIVKNPKDGIKVLGDGEVSAAYTLKGVKASASAKSKIEAAGGSISED